MNQVLFSFHLCRHRCLDSLQRKMEHSLSKVEERLEEVENKMVECIQATIDKTRDDLNFAEVHMT